MSIKHSNQRPGKGGSLLKKYLSTNIIVCSNPFFNVLYTIMLINAKLGGSVTHSALMHWPYLL